MHTLWTQLHANSDTRGEAGPGMGGQGRRSGPGMGGRGGLLDRLDGPRHRRATRTRGVRERDLLTHINPAEQARTHGAQRQRLAAGGLHRDR